MDRCDFADAVYDLGGGGSGVAVALELRQLMRMSSTAAFTAAAAAAAAWEVNAAYVPRLRVCKGWRRPLHYAMGFLCFWVWRRRQRFANENVAAAARRWLVNLYQ